MSRSDDAELDIRLEVVDGEFLAGVDAGDVSVARSVRDLIRVRYVARDGGVFVSRMSSAPNPTTDGEGHVPAALANYGDWPRSLVPPPDMDLSTSRRDPPETTVVSSLTAVTNRPSPRRLSRRAPPHAGVVRRDSRSVLER